LPGCGRPQAQINKDVDICDLFIGILWQRWGEPPSVDGIYTSGFEEEFDRAIKRRGKDGKLELWIYFKEIDQSHSADPGPQLVKVLKFKNDLMAKKELLYREFHSSDEWNNLLYDHLIKHILGLSVGNITTLSLTTQSIEQQTLPTAKTSEYHAIHRVPVQLKDLFSKSGNNFPTKGPWSLNFDEWLRFLLISRVWVYEHYPSAAGGLSVHEHNLIYNHRNDWDLSAEEESFLFRAMIDDDNDVEPAWFWFKDKDEQNIIEILTRQVISGHEKSVRINSLNLLYACDVSIDLKTLAIILKDEDENIITLALKIIREQHGINGDALFSTLDKHSSLKIRGLASKMRVLVHLYADTLVGLKMLSEHLKIYSDQSIDYESIRKAAFSDEVLLSELNNPASPIKYMIALISREKGLLNKDICTRLLSDENRNVRKEALLALIDLNESISMDYVDKCLAYEDGTKKGFGNTLLTGLYRMDNNQIKIQIMKKMNKEDLYLDIGWYDSGYRAYEVLATMHKEFFQDKVRADLQTNMESIKQESDQKLIAKLGTYANKIISDYEKDDLNGFIRGMYIEAAFKGLIKYENKDDIFFARKYFDEKRYGVADTQILEIYKRYGEESDVDRIIEYAKTEKAREIKQALEIAIKLSSNKEKIILEFLSVSNKEFQNVALKHASEINSVKIVDLFFPKLKSENEALRIKSLAILLCDTSKKFIDALLDEYTHMESYYYNVVKWLDRYLYAPGIFGQYYKKELTNYLSVDKE
jgi:hypothetical protein